MLKDRGKFPDQFRKRFFFSLIQSRRAENQRVFSDIVVARKPEDPESKVMQMQSSKSPRELLLSGCDAMRKHFHSVNESEELTPRRLVRPNHDSTSRSTCSKVEISLRAQCTDKETDGPLRTRSCIH